MLGHKKVLINLRLKLYETSFLTTMLWNQLQQEKQKIHRYVEIKQHAPEQPMGHGRNQKRNQKIFWNKRKWKTQNTKTYEL